MTIGSNFFKFFKFSNFFNFIFLNSYPLILNLILTFAYGINKIVKTYGIDKDSQGSRPEVG